MRGDKSDFEHKLPEGREFFSVPYLAKLWELSTRSIERLIEEGSIKGVIDVAPRTSKHAMLRIARADLIAFLDASSETARMEMLRSANRRKRK